MSVKTEKLAKIGSAPQNQEQGTTELSKAKTRHLGSEADEESASELPAGRNIIVAIGINEYQHHPALNNPINDAQAILALFKQCGFQELSGAPSLVANDATRAAIADLPDRLAGELMPDDNLVVFFAGHGEKREKQAPDPARPGQTYTHRRGYLIPVAGPQNKSGDWINLDAFLDEISGLPARHIFVILDACKSGIALAEKFKVRGGEQPTAVATLRQLPSRRVMTSAMHDEKAAEGGSGSGHSVFAEALIEAIQDRQADMDGDGYIKTVDLFSFAQDRVSDRAKKLFKLKQTPDYGYLPGDGGGDLVISLREGAFNRLIQEALGAMLRHDVPRLEGLVAQLIATNPTYPITLYLQFRLKFMQGDIPSAKTIVSCLLNNMNLSRGTLPLSWREMVALSQQLDYWEPVLSMPTGNASLELTVLTGRNHGELQTAPVISFPAGNAYQVEDGALAQFLVTNVSNVPLYLYFITIVPDGRLVIGPLVDAAHPEVPGLGPNETEVGRAFLVRGLPGSVIETRIFCDDRMLWDMMFPPTIAEDAGADPRKMIEQKWMIEYESYPRTTAVRRGWKQLESFDRGTPRTESGLQMLTIWCQIPEDATSGPVNISAIESAFQL